MRPTEATSRVPSLRVEGVLLAAVAVCALCGCNPSLDIDGALLPSWLIAGVIGLGLTVASRTALVRTGVDRHLVARPMVYLSLSITFTSLTWIVAFRF